MCTSWNSMVHALIAADVVVSCADEFASIGERLLGLTAVQETQVYATMRLLSFLLRICSLNLICVTVIRFELLPGLNFKSSV